jgi:hypothetical protein
MNSVILAALLVIRGAVSAGPAARVAPTQPGDRWQLTLADGTILWEIRLVRFSHDTLVVRHADSTYAFPIARVDELRLVQKSVRRMGPEAGRYGGVLGGTDDEVYRLTLYSVSERRQIVEQLFKDHPPGAAPAPP